MPVATVDIGQPLICRYFMENVCDRMLELDKGRCFMHNFGGPGSYELFKEVGNAPAFMLNQNVLQCLAAGSCTASFINAFGLSSIGIHPFLHRHL